jgi:hypothetical protein
VATSCEPRRPAAAALLASLLALAGGGCSPPQVEAEHRELVLGLVTAASARDPNLLGQAEGLIAAERQAGRLSAATDRAFAAIVRAGRAGDWDEASGRAFALRDAQKPTAADLARLQSRELPAPKLPPGGSKVGSRGGPGRRPGV